MLGRQLLVVAGVGWTAAALCTCGGQLPGPPVCDAQSRCGPAQSCVWGRCQPTARLPVRETARRRVFAPTDAAKLCADGSKQRSGQDSAWTLGDPGEGRCILLLRFALELPAEARVERALLVLEPLPHCARRPGDIELELSQVLSSWRSASTSWARQPELGVPMHAGTWPATPVRTLRLDVTELVAEWRAHRQRYHGLALGAVGRGPGGACYATGVTWGDGPRLEVFLAPQSPLDAGVDGDARRGDAAAAGDGADAALEAGDDDTEPAEPAPTETTM